ncbi:hypothetical protein B0A75_15515 [Flavobacterium oncorhynchi]|uniref:GmrSD restriction endonucleases N-terminal domain-containing protein n=1 Tax=Flavobacterium oncorhynchi TaxID=728056 RepID=A0A226HV00_9FLAO|nr:DUF262 domain-containing protein [Flavobacterium oncorhynchi]OXA98073.1 hypothetical protein B0A75_15515 [Flavobacterium oncorhynchi]
MFKIYKLGDFGTFNIDKIISYESSIDFHPVYQRYGGIWSKEKKQLFIDTILNDFDTPKFYFNYFSDSNNPLNTSNKLYAVIDGKQRLEAIFDFVKNKFELSSNFKFYDDEKINLQNLKFNDISEKFPSILSKFFSYEFDIIFVDTDDEDKLEELFLRLNGGEALTNAEKRNAVGGEFNRKVRDIVESNVFFTEKLRFKNPRYQHQDLFVKLALTESNNELVTFTNKVLYEFIRDNKDFTEKIAETFNIVQNNLTEMSNCFVDKDFLLASKGVIPVYYYFYTRHLPNHLAFNHFLNLFETVRKENRKKESFEANPLLMEYDRLNQQGVHLEKSLNFRYKILEKGFNFYQKYQTLENFSLDDSMFYDFDDDNLNTN